MVEREQRTTAKIDATLAAQQAQKMRLQDLSKQLVLFASIVCIASARMLYLSVLRVLTSAIYKQLHNVSWLLP